MARRLLASMLLCTAVAVQAPARAALYEFKLEGVVSYTLLPDVHIGDVAVMTFRVDDQDLEPSPNLGRYVAVGAVEVAFPEKSLVVGGSSGYFEVKLNNSNAEITQYLNQGSELSLNIPFQFPDGTLLTDHLPLSLPLALATNNSFQIFPAFHDVVYGRVTSYLGAPVPEPTCACGVVLWLLVASRMEQHRRRSRR